MKKLNILYIIGLLSTGGVEEITKNLVRNFNPEKIHIDFVVHGIESEENKKEFEKLGCRIFDIPLKSKHPIANLNAMNKLYKENHYDVVHLHTAQASSFTDLKLAKKYGAQVRCSHSHSTSPPQSKLHYILHKLSQKQLLNIATGYFCCGIEAGQNLYGMDVINNKKFKVINNGIDINKYTYNVTIRDEMRKNLGLDNCFVIGHVGRFSTEKNHDFLIDIFAECHKTNKNAVLMLVGVGELQEQIEKKINNLSLTDSVIMLGHRNDVNKLMQIMDVFILPSLFEAMPIVGIEAQAAGLQCVFADTVPIESDKTGLIHFLRLQDSPLEWADYINSLSVGYQREDTSEKMISAGYDIVSSAKWLENYYLTQCDKCEYEK